ncbi:MAG: T9SS type A sorting domain-containing protein [Lentimicrobium sp.]
MRSFLTSVLVILCIVSLGQSSYQIVDTTKTWNTIGIGYITWGVAVCGGTTTNSFRNISNPGDQFLDVLECRDSIQQEWSNEGMIREDTLNKQVFYKYGETEGLIYDFSLETGDTVHIDNQYHYWYDDVVSMIVDSIDLADIYGVMRKRFFLSGLDLSVRDPYYPDEIWIEGIGSNYGIMHSGLGGIAIGGGTDKLLCASQNDNVIYMDSLFHECYIDTFYPQILQWSFDTAYVNTYYEFQVQVDTGNAVSFALIGYIPEGFAFDPTTGLLSGTPTQAGSYPCIILAMDSVMNWYTDIIYEDIVVVLPTETSYTDKPKDINIYPNPFNTLLNIDVAEPDGQECLLEIYTSDGKLIRELVFSGSIKPDLSGLSNDLYLIRILDSKGNVLYNARIVKGR